MAGGYPAGFVGESVLADFGGSPPFRTRFGGHIRREIGSLAGSSKQPKKALTWAQVVRGHVAAAGRALSFLKSGRVSCKAPKPQSVRQRWNGRDEPANLLSAVVP
jgi:hypothetical protein